MTRPALHAGHRRRLRLRAVENRLDRMPPHEVLEFLLTYAIPLRDVNELAHRLIGRFGSLGGVLKAPGEELAAVEGVGESTADFLTLMGRAADEYAAPCAPETPRYNRAVSMAGALRNMGLGPGYHLVCLDAQGHLKRVVSLPPGFERGPDVNRTLAGIAIRSRAYGITLARMGGGPFTDTDREIVSQLRNTVSCLEILFMDQLLVDRDRLESLRAQEYQARALRDTPPDLLASWLDGIGEG